jgi:hypothetical protein
MFNGMWKDGEPEAQPQGTYRMAINAVKEPGEPALATELSNVEVSALEGIICGVISLDGEHAVVFTKPGNIYLYNQNSKSSTLLVELPCLNFNENYRIQGKYKVVNGCERVIYWNDGLNEDRYYNLDKPNLFRECDDFRLTLSAPYPEVKVEVISGGILKKGTYQFVIELLDSSRNVLLKTLPSDPVYVYQEGQGIRIDVSGIDAAFVRINAITHTATNGITIEAFEYEDIIPVTGTTLAWNYNGANVIAKDFRGLLSVPVNFDTSRYMEIVHGRLLRGNVSEKQQDYTAFQHAASKICTKYTVKESESNIFTELGDEVKAYGIVYLHKNGALSPVFHIPGRNKKASDSELVDGPQLTKTTDQNVTILFKGTILPSGDFWTLQYTLSSDRVITSSAVTFYNERDTVSSEQTTGTISIPKFIPGVTDDNYLLENSFIKISVVIGGERFENIIESRYDIDETIFLNTAVTTTTLKSERWVFNSTADKNTKELGYYESNEKYTNPVNYCGEDYWGVDCDGKPLVRTPVRYHKIPSRFIEPLTDGTKKRYIGVKFTNVTYPSTDIVGHFFVTSSGETIASSGYALPFNDKADSTGDKDEGRFVHYLPNSFDNERFSNSLNQNIITPTSLVDKTNVTCNYIYVNGEYAEEYADNRPFYDKFFRDKTDLQLFGKHHFYNKGFAPKEELLTAVSSEYVLYSAKRKEYLNRSLNHGMNVIKVKEFPSFNTSSANMRYVYLKRAIQPFQSVFAIRYRFMNTTPLTGTTAELYAGEHRITSPEIINVSDLFPKGGAKIKWYEVVSLVIVPKVIGSLLESDQINVEYEWLSKLYFESPYDFENIEDKYYFSAGEDGKDNIASFVQGLISDGYFEEGKTQTTLKGSVELINYKVNRDYGVVNTLRVMYPLPVSFDYCLSCRFHYPARIVFSDVNSQEQQSDSWRLYPALNYTDLPAHRGSLTAFDYTGGSILARMQRGLFFLQPDPQTIETDTSTIYLGTPRFLSIPPQEMAKDNNGYGGQQSRMASVSTPAGLFWYDEDAGKVFGYDGKINEISRKGMYTFFDRKSQAGKYFRDNNLTWYRDKTSMSYDPKYERVMLHCDDTYNNKVYSFTVSYTIPVQSWTSFHSYQPDGMFYLNRTFYTYLNNKVYSHNEEDYTFCKFYGVQHPYQVGLVYVAGQTQQWHSVHYYAPVFKFENGIWKDVLNKTFDKAFAFTRRQTTGIVDLLLTNDPQEVITWNERTKTVIQADRNYRIASLRDISVGDGVTSSRFEDLQEFYIDGQGYQDIIPVNTDFEKPQYEQLMFRDKFIQVRLLFYPNEHKMLTYIIDFTKLAQIR